MASIAVVLLLASLALVAHADRSWDFSSARSNADAQRMVATNGAGFNRDGSEVSRSCLPFPSRLSAPLVSLWSWR